MKYKNKISWKVYFEMFTVLESWILSFYVSWMWMWNPITPLAMESSEMVASFAISRHSDRMCLNIKKNIMEGVF
jgi:hypothetical protein